MTIPADESRRSRPVGRTGGNGRAAQPKGNGRLRETPPRPAGGSVIGVAVFVSGAVLLGVEISASRVVAPFFGNSLFVWGSLIGVVLAGLAVGYWAGGALADRLPSPAALVAVLGLGGLAVLVVPVVDEPLLEAVVSWDPGPRLNPLLASLALFGVPSIVLAAVSPVAIRLRARSLGTLGRTAGRLFALSTAGSIAGTLGTAFFLVPELGTNQLFGLGAVLLFAVAAAVTVSERLGKLWAAGVAAGLALACVATLLLAPESGGRLSPTAARNWSPLYRLTGPETKGSARDARALAPAGTLEVLYSKETQYHRLAVVEDSDTRYLRFDNSFQSAMYVDEPYRTRYRYTDFFDLALAYNPDARNVLFIGLGAGSAEKRMWRDFPDVQIDVVEIDPVVVDVAYRYFELPRDPRLRVHVGDGRRFLATRPTRWDAIVIDAFFADAIPFHLVTREFLELARGRLNPGGVIVTNAIGAIEGPGSRLFRSIYRTYRSAFPTVLVHPAILPDDEGDETFRNLILVAGEAAAPQRQFLAQRWAEIRGRSPGAPDLTKPILDRHDAEIPTGDVPTLTDDYAPTDALLLLFQ
jgi:spermidine synthase/MFS family permease